MMPLTVNDLASKERLIGLGFIDNGNNKEV